jgi:hypothetical protein
MAEHLVRLVFRPAVLPPVTPLQQNIYKNTIDSIYGKHLVWEDKLSPKNAIIAAEASYNSTQCLFGRVLKKRQR